MMQVTRVFTISLVCLCISLTVYTQTTSKKYLERAQTIYATVWSRYHVAAYPGLFLENYPSTKNDTITYVEGGSVKEKAVSFLWPFSGVYSATNVLLKVPGQRKKYLPFLDTLIRGVENYRDAKRSPVGYQAYPAIFEKSDRYYDDNGLVGIDYAEAYLNTKDERYLNRAKEIFTFILSGWSNDLGGGVTWLEGKFDQKPACSNGSATVTALKIYESNHDTSYLKWGLRFYNWMQGNLLDSNGIYANDKKLDSSVNKTFWTYNSGFMLESAVMLYKFTKDKKYLLQAQELAKNSYDYFSSESKNENLIFKIDLPWFVTVLFRGYEALYRVDGNYRYIGAIEHDLNYAWDNSRDQYGLVTHNWSPAKEDVQKSKWLLDEACIGELYARLSMVQQAKRK